MIAQSSLLILFLSRFLSHVVYLFHCYRMESMMRLQTWILPYFLTVYVYILLVFVASVLCAISSFFVHSLSCFPNVFGAKARQYICKLLFINRPEHCYGCDSMSYAKWNWLVRRFVAFILWLKIKSEIHTFFLEWGRTRCESYQCMQHIYTKHHVITVTNLFRLSFEEVEGWFLD